MKQTIYLAALSALIATGGAFAQEPVKSGKGGHWLMKMDQDGDGKVTTQEATSAAKARFEAADSDDDGKLSPEEMSAWRKLKHNEDILKRRDQDGDGLLSFEELTPQRDIVRLIERMDADGDGAIDAKEFAAGRKEMRRKMRKFRRGGDGHWGEKHKGAKHREDCDRDRG